MAVGTTNMDQFELYFKRADLDHDDRISGAEAVSFFKGSGLPTPILAQIWTYADQNRSGYLGRKEFYNALKLVTVAQSKRDLTPDIVKSAMYGPASAKIPAPRINLGVLPAPQANLNAVPPIPQIRGSVPVPSHSMGIQRPHGYQPQNSQNMRPHVAPVPNSTLQPQHGVNHGLPSGHTMSTPRPSTSSLFNDWLGEKNAGPTPVASPQIPNSGLASSGWTGGPTRFSENVASKPNGSTFAAGGTGAKDSSGPLAGNGLVPNSAFGANFFADSSMGKHSSPLSVSSAPGLNVLPSNGTAPVGTQFPNVPSQDTQINIVQQPTSVQSQQMQSTLKQNQQIPGQNSSSFSVRTEHVPSSQSMQPWPKMTQSDIQKYTKVFVEVDTDRDGKITGEQARTLFISWKLPRETLKQVWDLSDQDNDSMLSLKEFCIALYLMERHREGRSLPKVLPAGVLFEGTPFPSSGQTPAAFGAPVWRPDSGVQQGHRMTAQRQVNQAAARPPRPVPVPIAAPDEDVQNRHQKPKVPVLEKHLVDQLSTEEQSALKLRFQEATEADKKVGELEREILEAKQKIEFYRSKMQEIVLYKSRCDSRLNEITERVSADKKEVELLSKKYEDKYKQTGDVASKLTIEEASFRDMQDKKMELYRAIVKLEQDGKADDIQVRADRIQADLEEQVKDLNERCKMYGLRGKPTSLVELPFGWQAGIQEGAADWDENWDKFEDEGFTFVKELTLDVQNVIAPPKQKALPIQKKSFFGDEKETTAQSLHANDESENILPSKDETPEFESFEQHKDNSVKAPDSPAASMKDTGSPSKIFLDSSPRAQSESGFSDNRTFDEPNKATFDSHYDSDAGWDFTSPAHNKDIDETSLPGNTLFDSSDSWAGLNPIRTEIPNKSTFKFDSVPGTPSYSYTGSPPGNNLFYNQGPFASSFADSVPSTPAYSTSGSPRRQFSSAFADSVPSTPVFANSRFDSFNSTTPRDSFSRFDSFRSTANDSELDHGFYPSQNLARFDSMRSSADSDFGQTQTRESFARFDSMRSTSDGFPTFDEADPFGSHDLFKTSETPRRDSVDGWKAF